MKKIILLIVTIFLMIGFTTQSAYTKGKVKAKFYDFSDTVIDGELKKPSDLYIDAKKKVKFNRLLKLKKSFIKEMMKTSRDRVLK